MTRGAIQPGLTTGVLTGLVEVRIHDVFSNDSTVAVPISFGVVF